MTAVLVIDDEPDMLATIRAMLEPAGFTVSVASSAGAAIEKLNIVSPHVIVTDIYMPGGDGFELIAALRRYGLRVPVIAISGGDRTGNHDPLDIARRIGAVETLEKPFSRDSLIGAINRVTVGTGTQEPDHGNNADGG